MNMNFDGVKLVIRQTKSGMFLFEEKHNDKPVYGMVFSNLMKAVDAMHEAAFNYIF